MSDPLVVVPDSVWELTVERARIVARLAEMGHCSREQISEAAKILGISRAMIYRLLARFRRFEHASSLLPSKPGPRPGTKQLDVDQEKVIGRLIQQFYLSRQKPSVAALHREVARECFPAGVAKPSYKAVRARVEALDLRNTIRAREGAKTADAKFRPSTGSLSASEPLELVQIDHTLVDVIVVDDLYRKPIGRPWLSLAIDVATRNILGFFLSLKTPAANAVAMTISRAVLPKTAYLAGLQVDAEWPACGLPRSLHLDNAKEFRGRALIRGCEQHGIAIIHRPPLRPHYGGHIERPIGTLMGEVHLLPGATFSSVGKRGSYNSDGQATMTLAELEVWLAWQIAGVYHLRSHSPRSAARHWLRGTRESRSWQRPEESPQIRSDFTWIFFLLKKGWWAVAGYGYSTLSIGMEHSGCISETGRNTLSNTTRTISRVFIF